MYPITYRLLVMEILEGQTEMDAFLSNMPLVELYLENQTRVFWPPEFESPEPGRKYVWNVQAIDGHDNPVGQNEGWAEPKAFSVTDRVLRTPEFYNLNVVVVGADGERLRNASLVLYNREYPLGDHVFELPPGRYPYLLVAEGVEPRKGIIEVSGQTSDLEVVIPEPGVDAGELPSDTTVLVARPVIPVDVTRTVSQPVVVRPRMPEPTETADPDTVIADPDESVVVAEPVTPPVTEDPDETDPTDPDVVEPDSDESVVVAEPVTPPVTEDAETSDDTDIPDETDPSLVDECVCTECSITDVTISLGGTLVTISADNPMIVGEEYTIAPQYADDCPTDCPQDFDFEVTFSTYDFNGELIAEGTATARDSIQFSPRRSGNMVITIHARVLCGETVCECGVYTMEVPVVGRTVADGVISPVPGATTDPPKPDDPDTYPPGDTDDPVHPPVIGPPPTTPPEYPPYDPEVDGCDPSIDKDPGLPIVLNVYLEENDKFLYPRAVPLHALGIDWDYAYFLCTDCDESVSRYRFPVMDKVSTYNWQLQGKGSLNEPFTSQEVMDIEEQIAALITLLAEKQKELQELIAKIEALPDAIKASQEKAKNQIEEIENLNETIQNEIDDLQANYDELDAQYDEAHQRAQLLRDEIKTIEDQIEDYTDQLENLEEKLQNNPTEGELSQMEEVESKREALENKKQLVWDIEQDIIDQKEQLQRDIQQAFSDLETAIDDYDQLNYQVDTTQQEINRVLRQIYSVPVNRTLMDKLREWNASANQYLIYLLDTLNQEYESIVDMATVVNEVHRNSTLLIFTVDTLQREQMGSTLKQRVDQFVSMASQRCQQLPPGQPSSPCLSKVYWVSQRNRPYQNAVDSVVAAKPEFTAQQVHSLDSLRQALSDYEASIENLRTLVEQRWGIFQ